MWGSSSQLREKSHGRTATAGATVNRAARCKRTYEQGHYSPRDEAWTGEVGLITKLIDDIAFDPADTYAIVCGPPVMFKFVCKQLSNVGVPMHRMFVSLERRMHCGMGKCCRCNIGSTYTCVDGPVFDYWSVMNLKEAI